MRGNLGLALAFLGEHAAARKASTVARQGDAGNASIWAEAGIIANLRGDFDDAVISFDRALELDSNIFGDKKFLYHRTFYKHAYTETLARRSITGPSEEVRRARERIARLTEGLVPTDIVTPLVNSSVALRDAPEPAANVIRRLNRGEQVLVIGILPTTGWLQIAEEGVAVGWIFKTAVAPSQLGALSPAPGPQQEVFSGTGFVLNRKGEMLTNEHVVEACSSIRVQVRGTAYPVTLLASDPRNDLAILTLPQAAIESLTLPAGIAVRPRAGGDRWVTFRSGASFRVGDDVVVVGYPLRGLLAEGPNVTTGNVSALAGPQNDTRLLQITAPVQPGNSGGPLLDSSGNVIGIVVSKLDAIKVAKLTGDIPQNINFAINAKIAHIFLDIHGVEYTSSPTTGTQSTADIAETARSYVFPVECVR